MLTQVFRIVSYLEGISYILLMFVGMPLKYIMEDSSWVKALGMPHGLLFVAYIVFAIIVRQQKEWKNPVFFEVLIASVIPFGTFYIDKKYLKNK